jgi:putative peptidoglycan lipid II flippase
MDRHFAMPDRTPLALVINNRYFRSRIVIDTLTTTGLSTVSRALGILVPVFIAGWFGVSGATDAFFFSYGMMLFVTGMVTPVVQSVLVPFISEHLESRVDTGRFIGSVCLYSLLLSVLAIALLIGVVNVALPLLTRFDAAARRLVQVLFLEASPVIILSVLAGILSGTLNAHKKFGPPATAPGLKALVILGVIFLWKDTLGIHSILLGYLLGELIRIGYLAPALYRRNLLRLRFFFSLDSRSRAFFRTAFYQTAGMGLMCLNPIVDQTMASWLGHGSISMLHYAERLYMIPISFLTTGLMTTLLSHWSSAYYRDGSDKLRQDVKKALYPVLAASAGMSVVLILADRWLVDLFYGRGAFAPDALSTVGTVWACYLAGFTFYIASNLYSRVHLTLKNTRLLMKCALGMLILNGLLNYALMQFLGLAGIAMSTSLCYLFTAIYLRYHLLRSFVERAA